MTEPTLCKHPELHRETGHVRTCYPQAVIVNPLKLAAKQAREALAVLLKALNRQVRGDMVNHEADTRIGEQWTLDNIYTLARRELRRLERLAYTDEERDGWRHVIRLCEKAGCQGRGVLRDALGAVSSSPSTPTFCKECGCTTGGGAYCYEHAPYTITPLKDGSYYEDRNGQRKRITLSGEATPTKEPK